MPGSVRFGVISEYLDQELSPELFTKHRLQVNPPHLPDTRFFDDLSQLPYETVNLIFGSVPGSVRFGVISEYLDQELSPELFTKHRLQANTPPTGLAEFIY